MTPVRPARPEDAPVLATLILQASRSHLPRGLWDLVAPGSEADRVELLTQLSEMEPRSSCHWTNFLVADLDHPCVAAQAGYDPGDPGLVPLGAAIALAFEALGRSDGELAEALQRLEPYQRCVPEQVRGVWTIEWVATLPGYRGRGLARQLLEQMLEEGRRLGFRRAQVTTFIGNEEAEQAYLKAGFSIGAERRDQDFERLMGASGVVRLEREL